MSLGKRILELRKKQNISQEQLAKKLGTKGPAIGRYERDVAKPSIDTAIKMASILGVSLDYLVGNTNMEIDSKTLTRIMEVQNLPSDIKDKVFYLIDVTIRDAKAQKAYAS